MSVHDRWARRLARRKQLLARARARRDRALIQLRTRQVQAAQRVLGRHPKFAPWMLNGRPGNVTPAVQAVIARAVAAGLEVTATTNGQHAPASYHRPGPRGLGRAVDVAPRGREKGTAAGRQRMVNFQAAEADRGRLEYAELFGPAYFYIDEGVRHRGRFPRHDDHVHVVPR